MGKVEASVLWRDPFRVGECRANDGPREVPIHSALAGTVLRLTRGRAGDGFLIGDGADFGRTPSLTERRFDARRAGRRWAWSGRRWASTACGGGSWPRPWRPGS